MKKYKHNISNLDCANCAREIEEALNKNKEFKNATVNFNTKKITYESEKEFTVKELIEIIRKIEPEATISEEEINEKKQYHLSILVIAVLIGVLGYTLEMPNYIKIIMYMISYSLLLYRTTINAIKLLIRSKTINENALITISSIGALLIGEVLEGVMVITLYTIGKILEEKAINNSRKSIKDLINLKQPYANKKINNEAKQVPVEQIKIGDILIVKKLMWQIGLPMIVSMVLLALYNVVDSVFVANMKDTGVLANEALTYAFPIQILIIAIGVGTGIGLNALLSKNLGEKNQEEVNKIAGNGIFLSIVIYLIFLSLGNTNKELTKVCENAIHIASLSYIFMGFNVAIQGVFQALRYALRPLFTAFLRLIFLPLFLLLYL